MRCLTLLVIVLGSRVALAQPSAAPAPAVQADSALPPEVPLPAADAPVAVAVDDPTLAQPEPSPAEHEGSAPVPHSTSSLDQNDPAHARTSTSSLDEHEPVPDPVLDLQERQAACNAGASLVCFGLGRTTVTGMFLELEDARLNYDAAVMTRTGLRGGWGFGVRFGIDLWDWIPLHVGVRHASPNDNRGFTEDVISCSQEQPGAPWMCDEEPHAATTTAGAVFTSIETGVEPSFRIAKGLAFSPGLLLGWAETVARYTRSVESCSGCREVALDLHASAPYLAPSLRLTWLAFGLSVRYERYLAGDLRDGIAIGFDLGARYKAVASALPGEK